MEALNTKVTTLLKEKERVMKDYANDIRMRESEIETMRITFNEDLAKKEREKALIRAKYEEA